jgi:CO/xanthine dehydrogenase Mo-binding subunit
VAAADLRAAPPARASVATVQPVDFFDLTDLLTDAANLTASLITVTINPDGTASFALPRAEVGQRITTAVAMVIADELELPLPKVDITLSDARPELEFNIRRDPRVRCPLRPARAMRRASTSTSLSTPALASRKEALLNCFSSSPAPILAPR